HKSHNLLNSLFTKLKPKTPVMKNSNVVYSIPCENCPSTYIGMTSQLLKNRLNGHKYTKNASTALDKHQKNEKHCFNFNKTQILNKDQNYQKLIIKEMIEIKKDKNAINDRTDIGGLSNIYNNLIGKN
ncbi:MAG: GIY-YIG nuclease family protein, partial [Wolbachia endosymbiont of Pissodes strobi]|nr:GIY-YIG nuclease family protein [Wolbachia endosymbiont of Pissodes strobi]